MDGLALRMGLALATAAVAVAALVAVIAWAMTHGAWFTPAALLVVVVFGAVAGRRAVRRERFHPASADALRVQAPLQRLALAADVAAPEGVVERDGEPLSWTTAVPRRRPAVHVTTGLLDQLDDPQLEAVLAHELAHVVNRDALVMTMVAGAPVAYVRGVRSLMKLDSARELLLAIVFVLPALPPIAVLLAVSRILSRHRELIADRDAAAMTGSPAAVAGALLTLGAGRHRDRDLRDVFHFLPARDPSGLHRLWATHPSLKERLARLERMERELQG